jgi:predicted Zn-ribbon and HTH transcriptional regulator
MLKGIDLEKDASVLEPSAGTGDLADCLKNINPSLQIDCIELNETRYNTLVEKGYNAKHADFLSIPVDKRYDYVIAAPTFVDNVDCDHVIKMYEHIKPSGTVISIMSPAWMSGNSERQIKFRDWLKNKDYSISMLEDDSYLEDGKTVPTIIIKIHGTHDHRRIYKFLEENIDFVYELILKKIKQLPLTRTKQCSQCKHSFEYFPLNFQTVCPNCSRSSRVRGWGAYEEIEDIILEAWDWVRNAENLPDERR